MMTFKDDDSFFTIVMPYRCPIRFWDIYSWVEKSDIAKFRFIRDLEIEQDRLTLKEVSDIYPGVKTIGIVTNPWARAYYAYNSAINPAPGFPGVEQILTQFKNINFDSFESYLYSLKNCEAPSNKQHPTTPQLHWLKYNNTMVDYVLKAEQINEDFEIIKEYFQTSESLETGNFYIDYRDHYTDDLKSLVADICHEDIETFGYEF